MALDSVKKNNRTTALGCDMLYELAFWVMIYTREGNRSYLCIANRQGQGSIESIWKYADLVIELTARCRISMQPPAHQPVNAS